MLFAADIAFALPIVGILCVPAILVRLIARKTLSTGLSLAITSILVILAGGFSVWMLRNNAPSHSTYLGLAMAPILTGLVAFASLRRGAANRSWLSANYLWCCCLGLAITAIVSSIQTTRKVAVAIQSENYSTKPALENLTIEVQNYRRILKASRENVFALYPELGDSKSKKRILLDQYVNQLRRDRPQDFENPRWPEIVADEFARIHGMIPYK